MLHYSCKNDFIEFNFNCESQSIYLIGTFSNWIKKEEFKLNKKSDSFYLKKHIRDFDKIGNSGYPEYYFWDEKKSTKIDFDKSYPKGHYFNNQSDKTYNYLILPINIKQEELQEIDKNNIESFRIKKSIKEFSDREELANFRGVSGGTLGNDRLFRSYHPIIASRQDNNELKDIEINRQKYVRELMEEKHINAIINLSESKVELDRFMEGYQKDRYRELWEQNRIKNVPMAYETVYFMSDKNEKFNENELGFQDGIKTIIEFISQNKGPYLVHCRLGSDRTGVIIGFLQLFMGASKEEIKDNYLYTNKMGIGEYRSINLLDYALSNAFSKDCFKNSKTKIKKYLKNLGLPQETIEKAYFNLRETKKD